MDRNTMIKALRQKFNPSALEQAVSLEKPNVYDIELLSADEIERLYLRFFPKPMSVEEINEVLLEEIKLKNLRSIILADAQYMGVYIPNHWLQFNGFMKNRSILKKPLIAYKIDEFPQLIKQFKSMRSKFDKSKMQVGSRDWYLYFGFTLEK